MENDKYKTINWVQSDDRNVSILEDKLDHLELKENNDIEYINKDIYDLKEKIYKNEVTVEAINAYISTSISTLESVIEFVSIISIINLIINIITVCIH